MSSKYLLFFRGVLLLTLLLQSLYAPEAESGLGWIAVLFTFYGVLAIVLFAFENHGRLRTWAKQWSFVLDLGVASIVLYLSPGISSEYHIAFFLVILSSAFLQKPSFSFMLAGLACLIYAALTYNQQGMLFSPNQLLKLALLMVMAFFSTCMVDVARRVKQQTAKSFESRLAWMDRLSTIGKALSGVLHEVKTPLGTISLTAEYMGELLKRGQKVDDQIDIIRQESERATEILVNFLEFTRPTELALKKLKAADPIRKVFKAMKSRFVDNDIAIDFELDKESRILGSERHLIQLYTNLLSNALKAMPLGGQLIIEQEVRGRRILTRIRDSGTGIGPRDLETVFEPYRSSASLGQGYGLGLTICRWIAQKHAGDVRAESPGLGKGATFTVELPLA